MGCINLPTELKGLNNRDSAGWNTQDETVMKAYINKDIRQILIQ